MSDRAKLTEQEIQAIRDLLHLGPEATERELRAVLETAEDREGADSLRRLLLLSDKEVERLLQARQDRLKHGAQTERREPPERF